MQWYQHGQSHMLVVSLVRDYSSSCTRVSPATSMGQLHQLNSTEKPSSGLHEGSFFLEPQNAMKSRANFEYVVLPKQSCQQGKMAARMGSDVGHQENDCWAGCQQQDSAWLKLWLVWDFTLESPVLPSRKRQFWTEESEWEPRYTQQIDQGFMSGEDLRHTSPASLGHGS